MTPQAVIFDIGNVLIEWQPERYFDWVVGPERRRAMFAAVDLHGMNDRIDRGASFRDTVEQTARAFPAFAPEIRMWHDNWLELASPPIPRSVRLLHALREAGVPVFALSNFGRDNFARSAGAHAFLRDFDRAYISGEMKMAKPDDEIYAAVEADCGLAPGALLFADDRADNIATAARRGWQTHLFEGPDGWADALIGYGLLTPEAAR
ncbi:HAD family hydrolase [Poseidonocella sedimentorum]|uniref:2-haloacid dehalogenase n=1 Tax=Poseidonocella sedimentorum TaxID=871652 RepID=A0A1I6D2Z6_9RHOB|nr:HAD family phosphatase [Poseidonocella sedimentorum]SFQ99800.1 2-haloacid dehalogenase [Poseidonocella sedimentorum]